MSYADRDWAHGRHTVYHRVLDKSQPGILKGQCPLSGVQGQRPWEKLALQYIIIASARPSVHKSIAKNLHTYYNVRIPFWFFYY